jgi:ATP-dependent RNA helicase RhlE
VIHFQQIPKLPLRSIEEFEQGKNRILLTTDVMARGLDLERISHVINFDTPAYPEKLYASHWPHRQGRRAGGSDPFLHPEGGSGQKDIEKLMDYRHTPGSISPERWEISEELIPEERPKAEEIRLKTPKSHRSFRGCIPRKKIEKYQNKPGRILSSEEEKIQEGP